MQARRKFVFALIGVLFIMGIIIHVRLSMVGKEEQYNELKDRFYMDGITQWYNYSSPSGEEDLNGSKTRMDDPRLIARIRQKFLLPPSPLSVPYRLSNPSIIDTSMGQAERIMSIIGQQEKQKPLALTVKYFVVQFFSDFFASVKLLKIETLSFEGKRGGFFIECGALDGEIRSNTLVFERQLNWTGLLIEADPLNFARIVTKNRKAYVSPTCLSIKPYPIMVSFKQSFNIGKISDHQPGYKETGYVDVQCFPLYSYLLALNQTTVDYFSLDVEGNELEVLKTIPFEKLDIRTMSVEFIHGKEGKDTLKNFVESQGYILHSEVKHENNLANDFIFIKSSLRTA